jgi:hypothetical protein
MYKNFSQQIFSLQNKNKIVKKSKIFKQRITAFKKNETGKSDWLRHVVLIVSNKIKA